MAKPKVPREFLGAFKAGHRHASREFIDDEFSSELLMKAMSGCQKSLEALKWLTRFNNEYHKAVIKRGDPEALHKTPEMISDCDLRNYGRRNDLFTCAPIVRLVDLDNLKNKK